MADKLMYIPNDGTKNCPFCRLKLLVKTFEKNINIKNIYSVTEAVHTIVHQATA